MKNDLDQILKQALAPTQKPDFWLNQKILNHNHNKETIKMTKKTRRIPAALIALALLATSSMTAFAVWKYMTPDKVAQTVSDSKLEQAFSSKDAVNINETQIYGDYKVTLLGIVSGNDISQFAAESNGVLDTDKTYSVVAIENADGSKMPDTSDDAYNEINFLVSPLIRGCDPNKYNAITMNGGYTDVVENGILYRIGECDNVEMFSDNDIYLAVSEGTFYNPDAYTYDKTTGQISRNEDYNGLNALFTLPLDSSKAEPEAAKAYIKNMDTQEQNTDDPQPSDMDIQISEFIENLTPENIDEYAHKVKETEQTVQPDSDGTLTVNYEYNGTSGNDTNIISELFPDGKTGMSKSFSYTYSDNRLESLIINTYVLNEDGSVTFSIYVPK